MIFMKIDSMKSYIENQSVGLPQLTYPRLSTNSYLEHTILSIVNNHAE